MIFSRRDNDRLQKRSAKAQTKAITTSPLKRTDCDKGCEQTKSALRQKDTMCNGLSYLCKACMVKEMVEVCIASIFLNEVIPPPSVVHIIFL